MTKQKRLAEQNLLLAATVERETEVSDGIFEVRRTRLWLPLLAATAAFGVRAYARAQDKPCASQSGLLDWDEFLRQCLPVAKELHKDSSAPGQDAYLYTIASMATRLCRETIPRAQLGRFGTHTPPVEFGVGYRGVPFFVVEWRMAPNATLPPHCHPNGSVCTLGTAGEAHIHNYEILDNAPAFDSKQGFRVRETRSEVIAPGRVNTLSAVRDNIHTFKAGKSGARGIDISTYHGKDVGFSFLKIARTATDSMERIYQAEWTQL